MRTLKQTNWIFFVEVVIWIEHAKSIKWFLVVWPCDKEQIRWREINFYSINDYSNTLSATILNSRFNFFLSELSKLQNLVPGIFLCENAFQK